MADDTLSPWDAYRKAYEQFRDQTPSWRAHFTAHHMHALEAALRVYDPSDPEMVAERRVEADQFERVEAERDALQARLDAAVQLIKVGIGTGPAFLSPDEVREVLAALQGDQPTEADEWSEDGKREAARAAWNNPANRPAARKTPGGFPYRQHPHDLCGSNVERQQVGDPGHCEDCCSVGHVVAHPDLGCGDVGCYRTHGEEPTGKVDRG